MLHLDRKKGQKVMIGHEIEVIVVETNEHGTRLGFKAPRGINIDRKEIYDLKEARNEFAGLGIKHAIKF